MSVPITTLYAAILGLLFIPFTAYVGMYRVKTGISLLDGGDPEMTRRMRAQGNFVETVPLALFLILLMELNGASPAWLHGLGLLLLVARITHYLTIAFNPGKTGPRAAGMAGTMLVYLLAAGWLLLAQF